MNKKGPIIIVEDDEDDCQFLRSVFEDLGYSHEVCFFQNGQAALEYLSLPEVRPFVVLADVNMPIMDGYKLRDSIVANPELSLKCVPFIFLSTTGPQGNVGLTHSKAANGYYIKPRSYPELVETIRSIVEYWLAV